MNKGIPRSRRSTFPLRAKVIAVVMTNPQPIPSRPHLIAPVANLPSRIFWAVSGRPNGETLARSQSSKGGGSLRREHEKCSARLPPSGKSAETCKNKGIIYMFTLNVQLPLHSSLRQIFALYTACATFSPKLHKRCCKSYK